MSRRATVLQPVDGGACTTRFDDDQSVAAVAFTLPGERIEASTPVQDRRRGTRTAELLQVLEPSGERTTPGCRHFGACGGCQYQHATYGAQLEMKRTVLEQLMRRATTTLLPAITVEAADPWHYRNRIRLRVEAEQVGYSRRTSNIFLPVSECPIASPLLWRAAQDVASMVTGSQAQWPADTKEIELFTDAHETQVQASFHLDANVTSVAREAPLQFRSLCERWQKSIPQLVGAGLFVAAAPVTGMTKRVAESQRLQIARWGKTDLRYDVDQHTYVVSRGAFFQVNRFLTERMVAIVLGERTGDLAFDLFAGAGLFSLPLAKRFARVIAVEVGEPAVSDLRRALKPHGNNCKVEARTALEFLQSRKDLRAPELVVMDPPRAGLGEAVIHELERLGAPELVYISCDPASLARDAKALLESGYILIELHLLDLFPQTSHMETIAVFRR